MKFEDLLKDKTDEEFFLRAEKINALIIHHLLPTHIPFFLFLDSIFKKAEFIAIPYSLNSGTVSELRASKCIINTPADLDGLKQALARAIKKHAEAGEPYIIIEVGGYSATVFHSEPGLAKRNLIGIIEDTENGHRQHVKCIAAGIISCPVFSVARSPLKKAEDAFTGDAVVFSLEKILRLGFDVLTGKTVLVLGYGNIGKSVARAVQSRRNRVSVYEINPLRQIEAFSDGYGAGEREKIFSEADIIIGTTGVTSLRREEFNLLKDNVCICSASSKNIEIDLEFLNSSAERMLNENQFTSTYKLGSRKLRVLYEGQPINFIDMGIIGEVLYMVWAEIVHSLGLILSGGAAEQQGSIQELDNSARLKIAETWLRLK